MGSGPVRGAQAAISVDLVDTGRAEGTRGGLALINICHKGEEQELRNGSLKERKNTSQTANKHWLNRSAHKSNPLAIFTEVMFHLKGTYKS